ncbi:hypothetical protein [Kushneria sp. TE3]|uniref:hypothetical protein n=1 Tax=Kushneria sp. TE3 TaxID=3449832 RepID=UPI003F68349B
MMLTIDQIIEQDKLENPVPDATVKGDWFRVQWTPDFSADERLNIGIAFVSNTGERDLLLVQDFHRVNCLYNESAIFHAELARQVAETFVEHVEDPSQWVSPQLKIVKGGFAQGENIDHILSRLFYDLVPLSAPKEARGRRHSPMTRRRAYRFIKEDIASRLGERHTDFLPKDPIVTTNKGVDLYLPFRRDNGSQIADAATLVSADFTKPEKIQGELYKGHRDVSMASSQLRYRAGDMFIVQPGGNMDKEVLEQAEKELKDFTLYLDTLDIRYHIGTANDELPEMVEEWCLAQIA